MRNTTRRQITRYLSCIREAIYRDFVPHFLGCNKGRDFFLKQNTETAIELYKLKKDSLNINSKSRKIDNKKISPK